MISILFAARNSVYKTIPGLDVWDEDRNALNWPGGNPGIFHPPCRLWSMLSHFSVAPKEEKELARWSVRQIRKWGGVLEHPAHSKLWLDQDLPRPGQKDAYGFTTGVYQWWFGHRGRKATWLYICGIDPKTVPLIPFKLGQAEATCSTRHGGPGRIRDNEIEATPPEFANWLIAVAEQCSVRRLAA
jgi:hypothetical protein